MPQLIVALDSQNESANYIHIDDVKEDKLYYCPCCKGIVKPRAYKKNKDYIVQPHFYHETGGCDEETFVHFICKNWLFVKGCRFIVNGIEYEVDNVDIEKTLHTSFGDYRPDIVVYTTSNKVFFFEIRTTARKTESYIPKWDELGNDAVEVDTRYFINQKNQNNIPDFKLIYSDGKCFIKSYSESDYESIAKRKLEWKRQDKLNYKIQWERLDWFWTKLQDYKNNITSMESVLEYFHYLDYSDKLWIYHSIRNKYCVVLKNEFRNDINQHFYDMINSFQDDNIKVFVNQISPRIYEIKYKSELYYLDYKLHEESILKVKLSKGDILSLNYKREVEDTISYLNNRISQSKQYLETLNTISKLPYIKSITPYSHWASEQYNLHELIFTICFEDYVHNQHIKESLGKINLNLFNLSENYVHEKYNDLKKTSLVNLVNEFIKFALKNNQRYQDVIRKLNEICKNNKYLRIIVSNDCRRITLLNGYSYIFEYEYSKQDKFGIFEKDVLKNFLFYIDQQISLCKEIESYIDLVNSCQNRLWKITSFDGTFIILNLYDPKSSRLVDYMRIQLNNPSDIKDKILNGMKSLLAHSEHCYGIRFMEDN